jgi:hypothetical protein
VNGPAPAPVPTPKTLPQKPPPPAPGPRVTPAVTPTPVGNAATARGAGGAAAPPKAGPAAKLPPLSLASASLELNQEVTDHLDRARGRSAGVPVQLGNLADGAISLTKGRDGKIDGHGKIPYHHPALAPLSPRLAIIVKDSAISGHLLIGGADHLDRVAGQFERLAPKLGWAGIDLSALPKPENHFDNGVLTFGISGFKFKLAGYLDGAGSLALRGETMTFDARATINVKGLSSATLELKRDDQGVITGTADVPVAVANLSGQIKAIYSTAGTVEIQGKVGYKSEKFDGEVNLIVADAKKADEIARSNIPPEALAEEEAIGKAEGVRKAEGGHKAPAKGERAVAGWGVINFHVNEWLAGQANVVVDTVGHVTIVGKIAPPAEVELFKQRDYIKRLFPPIEIRASYGVPLVGNLFVFANIGMEALAKLGPGKLYKITLEGRYSTDPEVNKSFKISGSLNISAFAGLRLRAEGGAGVELFDHDIKVGVGINGLAGVRGYVEATPTIGMREIGDPKTAKKTEYHIRGHLEIAAQPFLGLSGDLFVELDSPWWSPAPDDKWTWPIGNLEYPLPGEFGIGADLDYVLGSDKLPDIAFGEAKFDSDKFMTDLMNDHVPPKKAGEQQKPGAWKEGEPTGTGPEAKPVQGVPDAADPKKPAQGQQLQKGDAAQVPSQEAAARYAAAMRDLNALAAGSETDPMTEVEIKTALADLKKRYSFKHLAAAGEADDWLVDGELNPKAKAKKGAGSAIRVKRQKAQPYDVGPYNTFEKSKKIGLHHIPQGALARRFIKGYVYETAPVIALPVLEHRAIKNITAKHHGEHVTLWDVMQRDIQNLVANTRAPDPSIDKLIAMLRSRYASSLGTFVEEV